MKLLIPHITGVTILYLVFEIHPYRINNKSWSSYRYFSTDIFSNSPAHDICPWDTYTHCFEFTQATTGHSIGTYLHLLKLWMTHTFLFLSLKPYFSFSSTFVVESFVYIFKQTRHLASLAPHYRIISRSVFRLAHLQFYI